MRTSVENEWLCARIVARLRHSRGRIARSASSARTRCSSSSASTGSCIPAASTGCGSCRRISARPPARPGTASTRPTAARASSTSRASCAAPSESQRDLETLFRAQLLFWMLAATDGHAKNFSIRILAGGRFQLTPLYDVLSAWPIIGKKANEIPLEKVKLAMAMPGERPHYLLKSIQRRHFEALGREARPRGPGPGHLIDDMTARAPAVIDEVQRGLPRGFPQGCSNVSAGDSRNSRAVPIEAAIAAASVSPTSCSPPDDSEAPHGRINSAHSKTHIADGGEEGTCESERCSFPDRNPALRPIGAVERACRRRIASATRSIY